MLQSRASRRSLRGLLLLLLLLPWLVGRAVLVVMAGPMLLLLVGKCHQADRVNSFVEVYAGASTCGQLLCPVEQQLCQAMLRQVCHGLWRHACVTRTAAPCTADTTKHS